MPTFFPAARSIPLIRATSPPLLTLALLVLRVLADHHDCTVALHNLALSTDLLYRRSHFHRSLLLSTLRQLQSIGDTCFREVIRLSLIHISEPTRLGMISYAVFCLKK